MAVNMVQPNVWTQMNYTPPRGQCNFKQSLMSPKCPCLRFMLHPLKSSSSYECDGCTHHASFHSMENKAEDEIRKRWELEAQEKEWQEEKWTKQPRKRLREIDYQVNEEELYGDSASTVGAGGNKKGKRKVGKMTSRVPKNKRIVEIPEDEDEYVD
ncbi:hypothetical protein K469DRAFT_618958 [Zopfia rhizophila CBS 207.26]|uniref:Uncharacterized protein n=1 Tax=Zopfia rhizophila CBS 207.26 TaxID=1314779 RepID=A0A6A6ESK9_9PEZI|nr:hypothetical protein K469DRAFT_618958 [Zopfia rhizophila CBS 207.26]